MTALLGLLAGSSRHNVDVASHPEFIDVRAASEALAPWTCRGGTVCIGTSPSGGPPYHYDAARSGRCEASTAQGKRKDSRYIVLRGATERTYDRAKSFSSRETG